VLDTALNDTTGVPPIEIPVGQAKFDPVMVIEDPAVIAVVVTAVTVGTVVFMVKLEAAVAIPPPV
jgi:hypothetical protein